MINLLLNGLIWLGLALAMYGLFLTSERQMKHKQYAQWKTFIKTAQRGRWKLFSIILFTITLACLMILYRSKSVGLVSLWLYLTPITFIIILLVNRLRK